MSSSTSDIILLLEKDKEILDLFDQALEDVVLFGGDIQTGHITILGELAKAYTALVNKKSEFHSRDEGVFQREQIPSFIYKHRVAMQELTARLMELNQGDLYTIMNNLGTALYKDKGWEVVLKEPKQEEKPNKEVILYKAKNGELAIRFPNQEARDEFKSRFMDANIPLGYCKGPQFAQNPQGKVPCAYEETGNRLYFPSYPAGGEEFAVNCVELQNRKALIEGLGLKLSFTIPYEEGDAEVYADGFFTVYNNPKQQSTIYFNQASEIFKKPGTFLKINTVTGAIEQCQIKDYNAAIVVEPNSRFRAQLQAQPPIKPKAQLVSDGIAFHAVPQPQPQPHLSTATLRVNINPAHGPELVIQFSEPACSLNWYKQITGLAKQWLGLELDNFLEHHVNAVTIKASPGVGHFGAYTSKPQTNGHFQSPQQLAINFVDSQLRDYFFSSLSFKKEDNEIVTFDKQETRGNAIYFRPEKLSPIANNKTLVKAINEIYMAECEDFIADTAENSFVIK